jgi:DNA-binding response OmpR family regulator
LVVDDEPSVRESLTGFLEDHEFEVLSAESGEEALSILAKDEADAAIVDIRLPGMDGDVLIHEVHQIRPAMRFLIYTGSTQYRPSEFLRSLGIGVDDVFRKPLCDMKVLVDAIHRTTGR